MSSSASGGVQPRGHAPRPRAGAQGRAAPPRGLLTVTWAWQPGCRGGGGSARESVGIEAGEGVLSGAHPSSSSSLAPWDGISVRWEVRTQHTPGPRTLTRAGGQVLGPERRQLEGTQVGTRCDEAGVTLGGSARWGGCQQGRALLLLGVRSECSVPPSPWAPDNLPLLSPSLPFQALWGPSCRCPVVLRSRGTWPQFPSEKQPEAVGRVGAVAWLPSVSS